MTADVPKILDASHGSRGGRGVNKVTRGRPDPSQQEIAAPDGNALVANPRSSSFPGSPGGEGSPHTRRPPSRGTLVHPDHRIRPRFQPGRRYMFCQAGVPSCSTSSATTDHPPTSERLPRPVCGTYVHVLAERCCQCMLRWWVACISLAPRDMLSRAPTTDGGSSDC